MAYPPEIHQAPHTRMQISQFQLASRKSLQPLLVIARFGAGFSRADVSRRIQISKVTSSKSAESKNSPNPSKERKEKESQVTCEEPCHRQRGIFSLPVQSSPSAAGSCPEVLHCAQLGLATRDTSFSLCDMN